MEDAMAGRERGGFAAMNREKQREIARRGGRAAHQKGTAHEFTREEARAAGRKGGVSVSQNRDHMSRIGRTGGLSSRTGRSGTGRNGTDAAPPAGADQQAVGGMG
jgi:general stress protein YciG